MQHCDITFREVVDTIEGAASDAVARKVRAHMSGSCTACADRVSWIERFAQSASAEFSLTLPPAAASARAHSVFGRSRLRAALRTLVATLTFDTAHVPTAYAGARDATSTLTAASSTRRLYTADKFTVDIATERSMSADGAIHVIAMITDSVTGADLVPLSATLVPPGSGAVLGEIEDSEMHFTGVRNPEFSLYIASEDALIVVDHRLDQA